MKKNALILAVLVGVISSSNAMAQNAPPAPCGPKADLSDEFSSNCLLYTSDAADE